MPQPAAKWHHKPDAEVIAILEQALAAARLGLIKTAVVIVVNPMREAEIAKAGVLDQVNKDVLTGALVRASREI